MSATVMSCMAVRGGDEESISSMLLAVASVGWTLGGAASPMPKC